MSSATLFRPVMAIAMVGALFAMGGCLTLPDRVEESARPMNALPGMSGVSADQEGEWPTGDWWKSWNDPALTEVIEQGLKGSPDLVVALARYRRAEGVARSAGGSAWPSLSVGGEMTRTRQSDNGMLPTEFFDNPYTDSRLLASLSWDLSFWGASQKEADAWGDEARATAIEAMGVRQGLSVAIARAYYGAGLARQEGALADQGVATARKLYDLIALRWQKGLESRLAERQAFGLLAKAESDRADAYRRLTHARNMLAALCGEGPDQGAPLDRAPDLMTVPVPSIPTDLPVGLLARRADLAAALARVESAMGHERAAEARFYPSINLAAFVGYQSLSLDTLFNADSLTWSAGPALRIPLFMGGALRGRLMVARAGYDEAVGLYHQRLVASARRVADRLADLDSAAERQTIHQQALDAADEASRLARLRYERGIDDYRTPLEAEERLLEVKRIGLRLKGEALGASLGLIDALGGGFIAKGKNHDQR